MDFALSPRAEELRKRLGAFMDECVYPRRRATSSRSPTRAIRTCMRRSSTSSRSERANGACGTSSFPTRPSGRRALSNLDYAPLAEMTGRSPLAPEALNCSAPDTGNMELLTMFGTEEQKERWLRPLLEGEIRSCFAMTEPAVASSDATNISLRIERDDDHYVLNGRKWWISGAARALPSHRDGQDRPRRAPHRQQSMVLVPMDAPGLDNVPQPPGVRLPGQRGPL